MNKVIEELSQAGLECGLTRDQINHLIEKSEHDIVFDPEDGEFRPKSSKKSKFAKARDAEEKKSAAK